LRLTHTARIGSVLLTNNDLERIRLTIRANPIGFPSLGRYVTNRLTLRAIR